MLYKLIFFIPEHHCEQVKNSLFAMGAGQTGNYEHCSWQTLGQGQFRPLPGSQPHLGKIGYLEVVAEYKVEMICPAHRIKAVTQTLLAIHPYEQPAYEIYPLLTLEDLPEYLS